MRKRDLDQLREYWSRPTGMDEAPPGMVEFAKVTVDTLCDEVERLRAAVDDLHCEIGAVEWEQLRPSTRLLCTELHTEMYHPEMEPSEGETVDDKPGSSGQ